MGRRGRRGTRGALERRPPTEVREGLERRWYRRLVDAPALGELVTGQHLADEPFHRWLPYKQAFSPVLVRMFLEETGAARASEHGALPLLDPFAGAGTFVIEGARRGVAARGVEALGVLAFVAQMRGAREFVEPPDISGLQTWEELADRLEDPLHRAALICAHAARHTADGKPLREAPPVGEVFARVLAMMRADLARPLPLPVEVQPGDARALAGLADGSVGGILTSPPYLSRHDYTRSTRPHEAVYAHWHADADLSTRRRAQVRAHPKAHAREWSHAMPAGVAECVSILRAGDEPKIAGIVRSYFDDLAAALGEMARVLRPGSPCWLVVGGARLKDVYIPADLLLAELAEVAGFFVTEVRVARRLIQSGRKLGTLEDVSPREAVVVMRRG